MGLAKALLAQGKGREAEPVLGTIKDGAEFAVAEKLRPLASYLIASRLGRGHRRRRQPGHAFLPRGAASWRKRLIGAMNELLTVLRHDKRYRNGEPRLVILGLLELLDDADPQNREYLNKLASALF